MYRLREDILEVFLVHPGGPFFARKDAGVWTIPKGEPEPDETLEETACREFEEETGIPSTGPRLPLGAIRQKGGKVVHAWAFPGDWREEDGLQCNTFELDWPPRSGRKQEFPEIDRAAFFSLAEARSKINPAQAPFLDTLANALGGSHE
jgi:predicted NUDIX family NTP pyrophosphohydrolase